MEITGSSSIVDYIKFTMMEQYQKTQYEIDQIISRIPEGIRDGFVNGRTETLIEFSIKRLEMPPAGRIKEPDEQ